jgi:hypothetical protein
VRCADAGCAAAIESDSSAKNSNAGTNHCGRTSRPRSITCHPLTLVCPLPWLCFAKKAGRCWRTWRPPRELRGAAESRRLQRRETTVTASSVSAAGCVGSLCTETLTHGTTGQTNEQMHTTQEGREGQREEERGIKPRRARCPGRLAKNRPLARVCLTMHAFVYVCCPIPQPLLPPPCPV